MSEQSQLDDTLLRVQLSPTDEEAWTELEEMASSTDKPEAVLDAYRSVLAQELAPEDAVSVGKRAVRFHQEWFGDDRAGLASLLRRVLELHSASEWAFQELSVVLTVGEKWDEVIELYQDLISTTTNQARLIKLLDEAYQVTKDLANRPLQAIDFLKAKLQLAPSEKQQEGLERLLEKHERWQDLIDLWQKDLDDKDESEQRTTHSRIAEIFFDKLGETQSALTSLRLVLNEDPTHESALALLERLATTESVDGATRDSVLSTVREVYDSTSRPQEVVRILSEVLGLCDTEGRKALHAELGERLSELEEHGASLDHFAALLILDPSSVATQRSLKRESQLTGKLDRYASALASAADETEEANRRVALLADAAGALLDTDPTSDRAIELMQSALDTEGIAKSDILRLGKRQAGLLEEKGRNHERLNILERVADAESVASSRRAYIGDLAALAEELGEVDRALAAWRRRLEENPDDRRAMEAVLELLQREERWTELVVSLRASTEQSIDDEQKRSRLVRIAEIQEQQLDDTSAAAETWNQIRERFGDSQDVMAALSRTMSELGQWSELTTLLETANSAQIAYVADQYASLGQSYQRSIGDSARAISSYGKALAVVPAHQAAREGLSELLQDEEHRNQAAEALVSSLRASGDYAGLLDIVDARLAATDDVRKHVEILREAADIAEELERWPAATNFLSKLLPLTPRDRSIEDRLIKAARSSDSWDQCLHSFGETAEALGTDNFALAQLRFREATLRERELDDPAGALTAYLQVVDLLPDHRESLAALSRLAGPQERIGEAVAASMRFIQERQELPEDVLNELRNFASDNDDFGPLSRSLYQELQVRDLDSVLAAELRWRLAKDQLEMLDDSKAALQTIFEACQLAPNRADVHHLLAELQDHHDDNGLYDTLVRLCEIDRSNLDNFIKAAVAARESRGVNERENSLLALQSRTVAAWRGTEPVHESSDGEKHSPAEIAAKNIEDLVALYLENNKGRHALDVLIEGARLPFSDEVSMALRTRAARIAADNLGDNKAAIDMLRSILAQSPDNLGALRELAQLYKAEGRLPELLGLKRQELHYCTETQQKLELRLELSALIDEIDRTEGRLALLRANLEEEAGHSDSISAVTRLLSDTGRFSELADLLTEQATRLEKDERASESSQLWNSVAKIFEEKLTQRERAMQAYRKVAQLSPTFDALDSLARLHIASSQSASAVPWLEQALGMASDEQKPLLVKRLAEANVAAGQIDDAIASLEKATLESSEPLTDLRYMLVGLHRDNEAWAPLARDITQLLPFVEDKEELATLAHEAANMYHEELETPEHAIPALEKAIELLPKDKSLRLMMARSQRAAENPEAAKEILDQLVEEYGRRRSQERAEVHVERARVARVMADLPTAMSELELASKMDSGNSHILRELADLAREQGDLEQAERSLRALLLVVRRQPPGEDATAVGLSEVLFELKLIAEIRDDEEKARELHESVLEAAGASDAETRRLRRTLLEHGQFDLLESLLQTRIEASKDDASQAILLGHLAQLQESHFESPAKAFDTRLRRLELEPGNRKLHERTKEQAVELGKVSVYLESLEALIANQRRQEDATITVELLLRAGNLAETEGSNLEKARTHYAAAEELADNPSDALFALARVCAELGDVQEQARALDALTKQAVYDGAPEERAGALYKLAELQAGQPKLVERGLELLSEALEAEPRFKEAAKILRVAADTSGNDERVLSFYESAARQSGDKRMLLDYLERKAESGPSVEGIREAASIAMELQELERATTLMEKALSNANESGEGIVSAIWAVPDLVRNFASNERFTEAKELLLAAAPYSTGEDLRELGLFTADAATESKPSLAIDVLEFLLEREPSERSIWGPLLELYRAQGEGAKLSQLVDATLPSLVMAEERTQLRVEKARWLSKENRDDEAIQTLRDACMDDPDNIDAAALLEDVLRREGNEEALSEFLWQRFHEAKDRGNPETVSDVALRLATLLDQLGQESIGVFRQALETAPSSAILLRGILQRLGDDDLAERANLSEKLLSVEDVDKAAELSLQLAAMRKGLSDDTGVERALELGLARVPSDETLGQRLEAWYQEREQFHKLALMKSAQAAACDDEMERDKKVALYSEAAALYRNYLGDMDKASECLLQAHEAVPSNAEVASELASVYVQFSRPNDALVVLSRSLGEIEHSEALPLLLSRSDLYRGLGQSGEAIVDLERALPLDGELVTPLLSGAVDDARRQASEEGDQEAERKHTFRLIELADARGDQEATRNYLAQWVQRRPEDVAALTRLRDIDLSSEHWEGVVGACAHLVARTEGEEQAHNALLLFDAASKSNQLEQALTTLEGAYQAQPQNDELRDRLRGLYEQLGHYRQLATLLMEDAQNQDDDDQRYETYRRAASIYVNELGDAEAAIAPAQSAKEIKPDDHQTVVLLADVLIGSGKLADAEEMLNPAIAVHKRRSPELAELQYRMAKIFASKEDKDGQLAWLKKAFDVDRKDGLIASELAHLATELGDYDLALKPLRAITLMDDPSPVSRVMALLWEAKIEHARGNRAKAELWAKKALREDPNYQEAEEFLAQLEQ